MKHALTIALTVVLALKLTAQVQSLSANAYRQTSTTVFERSDVHSPEETKKLEAEVGWKFGYRIPSLLVSKQGVVLAFADRRKVNKKNTGATFPDTGIPTDVVLKRSLDGGRTWQKEQILFPAENCNYHSAMVVSDANSGRIYKFARCNPLADNLELEEKNVSSEKLEFTYQQLQAKGFGDFYVYSDDDGQHWSSPQIANLPYPENAHNCGLCNSVHGIQFRSGRMLILGKYVLAATDGKMGAYTQVFYSDDSGKTWNKGLSIHTRDSNLEVVMAKVDEQTVLLNHRPIGSKKDADSARNSDLIGTEGESLITSYQGGFYAAVCHVGMAPLAGSTSPYPLFISAPNASVSVNSQPLLRKKLTLMCSRNNGKSWERQRVLDDDFSGYSDLQFSNDGSLLCLYESGKLGQSIKCLRIEGIK